MIYTVTSVILNLILLIKNIAVFVLQIIKKDLMAIVANVKLIKKPKEYIYVVFKI
jgi:hypothetical protein